MLAGKVAVITGGASGIGRGIALALADAGARVSLMDVNHEGMKQTAQQIEAQNGEKSLLHCADVRSKHQVQTAMTATMSAWERIDILVTAAGVSGRTPLLNSTEDEWDRIVDTNLKGTYLCAQAASQHMVRGRRGGRIITIASINAFWAKPQLNAYCASKGGVAMLTRCMAVELGEHGITANAICPGVVETPLNMPIPDERRQGYLANMAANRLGLPADVASLALYLASDASGYMTGAQLVIDGGLSIQ